MSVLSLGRDATNLARPTLPPWRDLRWARRELRGLFAGRHPRGGLGDNRADPLPCDLFERSRLRREMHVEGTVEVFTVAIQSVVDRGDILGVIGNGLLQGTPLQILRFESIAELLEQFGLRREMFRL